MFQNLCNIFEISLKLLYPYLLSLWASKKSDLHENVTIDAHVETNRGAGKNIKSQSYAKRVSQLLLNIPRELLTLEIIEFLYRQLELVVKIG